MLFRNLVDEITAEQLQALADKQRQARIDEYSRRYKELTGNVYSDNSVTGDATYYWPVGHKEMKEQYAERYKLWVPWPDMICRRLTDVCLSEPLERRFEPLADTAQGAADLANEVLEISDEASKYTQLANRACYHALGIGETALWPEFRRYSRATGEPYAASKGEGAVIWSDWFPWFVEPIVMQDYVQEIIGAAKIYYLDNQQATAYISQTVGRVGQQVVVELFLAPEFDHMSGDQRTAGCWRRWINGTLQELPSVDGLSDWSDQNHYGLCPVVFFRGPDPDETQYRGKPLYDRFRDLAIKHSRIVSSIGQAVQVLPNIWKFLGPKAELKDLVIRPNTVVHIDAQGGDLSQAARALDLHEEWALAQYLDSLIFMAAQLPPGLLKMLEGAGHVATGVALKILFQPLIDCMSSIRTEFRMAEEKRMYTTLKMWLTHNPGVKLDLDSIRPEVVYNENLIPTDDAAELLNDLSLVEKGYKSPAQIAMKYNPEITTELQAEEFIAKNKAGIQAQQPRPFAFPSLKTIPAKPEEVKQ